MSSGLLLQGASPAAAAEHWSMHLRQQSQVVSAARLGNWLSVANTAITYYAVRRGAEETVRAIREASLEQKWEARENAQRILHGLEDLGDRITRSVAQVGRLLDDRLALVVDQIEVATAVSRDILAILHVPEFQKERRYYYEQGLRHYANARFDAFLYDDALRSFKEAETRDPSDPQVLYRIGLICLYAESACELEQAYGYLQRASKYAFVAAQPDAARAAGVLQLVDGDQREQKEHESFAATVLCDFSIACMALQKLDDARDAVQRALAVAADYLPARVQYIRVLSAMTEHSVGEETLRLLRERPEAAAAFVDDELLGDPGVQEALATYRREQTTQDAALLAELAGRIGSVQRELAELAGEPMAEAAKLLRELREVNAAERQDLAAVLVRKLRSADARLDFSLPQLRARMDVDAKELDVYVSDRGRLIAVLAKAHKQPGKGAPTQYNLVSVVADGPRVQVQVRMAMSGFSCARGVLADDGGFFLDGAAEILNLRGAERIPVTARKAHATYVGNSPCWLEVSGGEWTLSDARNGTIHLRGKLKTVSISIGEGAAARSIMLDYAPLGARNPGVFLFGGPGGKANTVQVVLLHSGREIDIPLPPIQRRDGNSRFVAPVDARLSRDASRLLVRSGFDDADETEVRAGEVSGTIHLLDVQSGRVLRESEGTGALPAFTPAGDWMAPMEGLDAEPGSRGNCDLDGVVRATWKRGSVSFAPGPGASSLLDFVEAYRRAEAVRAAQQEWRELAAAEANCSRAGDQGGASSMEARMAEFKRRLDAVSAEANAVHLAARKAQWKEERRWFGKKTWDAVLALYERALALGYPAEDDIAEIRNRMGV